MNGIYYGALNNPGGGRVAGDFVSYDGLSC
jgi:hypothetical protein